MSKPEAMSGSVDPKWVAACKAVTEEQVDAYIETLPDKGRHLFPSRFETQDGGITWMNVGKESK